MHNLAQLIQSFWEIAFELCLYSIVRFIVKRPSKAKGITQNKEMITSGVWPRILPSIKLSIQSFELDTHLILGINSNFVLTTEMSYLEKKI